MTKCNEQNWGRWLLAGTLVTIRHLSQFTHPMASFTFHNLCLLKKNKQKWKHKIYQRIKKVICYHVTFGSKRTQIFPLTLNLFSKVVWVKSTTSSQGLSMQLSSVIRAWYMRSSSVIWSPLKFRIKVSLIIKSSFLHSHSREEIIDMIASKHVLCILLLGF